MKRNALFALGGAALAVSLAFAPMTEALANDVDIQVVAPATTRTIAHDVCGNSDDAAEGDCGQPNDDTGNTVTIGGGVTTPLVYGRKYQSDTSSVTANNNTVNVSGSSDGIYGGEATNAASGFNATASGNHVTVSGADASVWGNIYGGVTSNTDSAVARASNNEVSIEGGQVMLLGFRVAGGASWYCANCTAIETLDNKVSITGGTVGNTSGGDNIYGGYIYYMSGAGTPKTASGNAVSISGGTVYYNIYGAYIVGTGTASGNTVSISGGAVGTGTRRNIYGGYTDGAVSGNTVSITGGTLTRLSIYGGYTGSGTVSGNTVEIGGSVNPANFTGISLYGGYAGASGTSTNNTLELRVSGLAASLGYFQNLNFHVPASLTAGQTMLTGSASLGNPAPVVSVEIESGSPLKVGDQIVLIDASAGSMSGTAPAGVTSATPDYAFSIVGDPIADKRLVVEVTAAPAASTSLTAAAVNITAPADGNAPSATATVPAGSHYTASAVTWSPADNPFVAGASYTATVVLTAESGYSFTGLASPNVRLNGMAPSSVSVNAAGDTVTLTYVFGPLAPRGIGGGATSVPTLGEWSLALLALLLAGGAVVRRRRRS